MLDAPATIAKKLSVHEAQKDKSGHLEQSESKQVVWHKDHQEIEMEAKYQVVTEDKSQITIIKDLQPAEQGIFTCVASEEVKTSINLDREGISPCCNVLIFLL